MSSARLRTTLLVAIIWAAALAAAVGAQPPPVPFGESNLFLLDTNRFGFADSGDVTFIIGVTSEIAPTPPALVGTYPNPFNPRLQIRFVVAHRGTVALDVHDLRGRRVRRLERADVSPGEHSRVWDGRSDAGDLVPAGVYVVRLVAGETVSTAKITLVR